MNAYFENPNSIGFSLSCAVYVDYRSKKEVEAFRKFHEEMSKAAVDLEGTMSTYMSDTYLKVPYFEYEHGKSAAYMKKIKSIFDPKGIMNPGKKFARSSLKEVAQ
jgi:glycolate oxidase